MKYFYNFFYRLFLLIFILLSCTYNKENNKAENHQDNDIYKNIINLNLSNLKCLNCNDSILSTIHQSKFKIIVYGDLYCSPCFDSFKIWESYYSLFYNQNDVVFVPIIYSLVSDYESEHGNLFNDSIAVFIDTRNRFRIVNKLGNNPEKLSMLLDHNNHVIHYGSPDNIKTLNRYKQLINE